jgi:hypothetical protein
MRNSALLLSALALLATAAPSPSPQKGLGGAGGCKKVTLIFARGSTEGGSYSPNPNPLLEISTPLPLTRPQAQWVKQ